jgi:hypothetical protein
MGLSIAQINESAGRNQLNEPEYSKSHLVGALGTMREISQNMGEICLVDAKYNNENKGGPLTLTIQDKTPYAPGIAGPSKSLAYRLTGKIQFGNAGILVDTPFFNIYALSIPIQGSHVRFVAKVTYAADPAMAFPIAAFIAEGTSPKNIPGVQNYNVVRVLAGTSVETYAAQFTKSISIYSRNNGAFKFAPLVWPTGAEDFTVQFAPGEKMISYPFLSRRTYKITNDTAIDDDFYVIYNLEF